MAGTGNPVPSDQIADLKANAETLDQFVSSTGVSATTRTGKEIKTIAGVQQDADSAVKSSGWFVVGEFSAGFMFTAYNQVGRDSTGQLWSYNGSLPFTVTAGTVPSSPDYTNRGDAALRSALADPAVGSSIVANSFINLDSVADMIDFDVSAGRVVAVKGQDSANDGGFAYYLIEASGGDISLNNGNTAKKLQSLDDYKFDIIVCYGQSNTVGFAGQPGVPAADDAATPTPLPWSLAYDPATRSIVPVSNTMNHLNYIEEGTSSRGNAWTAFANKWTLETGRGCVIINAGRGGKSIAELSKGSGTGSTNYYQVLLDGYASTKTAMNAANLPIGATYCVFLHGETDMSLGTNSVTYRNALNTLAGDLFTDIPELQKFGVYIVGCPDSRGQAQWERIQAAQWAAVQYGNGAGTLENMAVIFDGIPTYTQANGQYNPLDGTHYSQRGYNQMGEEGAHGLARWVREGSTFSASYVDTEHRTRLNGTSYRALQLVQGMASFSAGNWQLLQDSNGSGTMWPCHVQRIDLITSGIRFVMSGKRPISYGFMADLNSPGVKNNISTDVTPWAGTNEWGFDVTFYGDLEFGIATNSGDLFTGSPLTPISTGSLIDNAISVTVANGIATLTHPALNHAVKASYYSSSAFEAGSVGARATSATETKISIGGTSSPVAMVSMQKVPLARDIIEGLSQLTVRLTAYVSDDL